MEPTNYQTPSTGLLKACSTIGVIGIIVQLIPLLFCTVLDSPGISDETLMLISSIGSALFAASLITVLIFSAAKIKNEGQTKPSPIAMYILAALLAIGVVTDFCTVDDMDSSIDSITTLLIWVMMIVLGILCAMQTATKKIGIWMIGSVVGIILASVLMLCLESVNKLILVIILMIAVAPVGTMFDAFKNYLVANEPAE